MEARQRQLWARNMRAWLAVTGPLASHYLITAGGFAIYRTLARSRSPITGSLVSLVGIVVDIGAGHLTNAPRICLDICPDICPDIRALGAQMEWS